MGKLRFLPKESLMHRNRGFTLVEVLVAIAVSSIALASLYVAYDIIERRYTKLRETAIMQQTGRSVLRIIERDIRIAGFRYQDDTGSFVFGVLTDPLTISDSGDACCDEILILYDQHDELSGDTDRLQIRYWVEPHTGSKGTRDRLFKQTSVIQPDQRKDTGQKQVTADYIQDLQFVESGDAANPKSLISIYLALRTKKEYSRDILYERSGYYAGNSTINVTDGYRRSEFGSTIAVRNLMF
jgi:prepilin-type N-terminal cleavage/methylation domain-containing protein